MMSKEVHVNLGDNGLNWGSYVWLELFVTWKQKKGYVTVKVKKKKKMCDNLWELLIKEWPRQEPQVWSP